MTTITDGTMDFIYPGKDTSIIKVIGVGGGGGNAVEHMFKAGMQEVSFVLCNTYNQALNKSNIPRKVQLGVKTTEGLGAGNRPDRARLAAEESIDEIHQLLDDGTKMVFITAGMGGGTGTGAAPVVAQVAKDKGILTIGIVTIPFLFEGKPKIIQALKGVEEISHHVDALLVINNERLRSIYTDSSILNAFQKADETLTIAAQSIAEIITIPGIINLDFRDVENTLKDGGVAIMSTGIGEGENRLSQAIENALHSPLLNNNNPFSAKKVLFNIYSSSQNPVQVPEMDQIHEFMNKFNQQKIEVIWGIAIDDSLEDTVKVTLLASGYEMSNIPGMVEKQVEESTEQAAINQEQQRKVDKMIGDVYGIGVIATGGKVRPKPIILTADQLDDEALIELLELHPSYNRDSQFAQKILQKNPIEAIETAEVEVEQQSESQPEVANDDRILF
jgi:cell division protein FtsZ